MAVFTDAIPVSPDLASLCVGLFREGELFGRFHKEELR
jgi:hypothetical protein